MLPTFSRFALPLAIALAVCAMLFSCEDVQCEAAIKSGRFKDEIVPVTVPGRKGDVVVDTDEHPTFGTTVQSLSKLRPPLRRKER